MPLTFKDVAEILKLIDASDCDEVVLELEGTRLVVRRNAGGASAPAPAQAAQGQSPAPATKPDVSQAVQQPDDAPGETGLIDVRSPMVGTFYRSPSPEDGPFVEKGSKVKKGDTLCLVEVMKLFTAVEATDSGTIAEVVVEDGATIEFNQLLFRIRP